MRRPLVPALVILLSSCLLAASAVGDPGKTAPPKKLKDKVCKDGAYVRPKPKKEPAAEKSATGAKADKPADAAPKLPSGEGGSFSPSGDSGVSKFTPGSNGDCSNFDKLFESGPNGAPALADSLEIAPATKNGEPPAPERFTSLSGLSKLLSKDSPQSARMMGVFFDGGGADSKALDEIKQQADALGAAAADGSVLAEEGSKPLPDGMSPARPEGLKINDVPDPNKAIIPPYEPIKARYNPAVSRIPPPAESSTWQGIKNNAGAVFNDLSSGGGLISSEGLLPRNDRTDELTTPPVNPNPDSRINVPLPGWGNAPPAPGIKPACKPGCYGTQMMIDLLKSMGAQYSEYYGKDHQLSVGGISLLGGGPFPPHVSHRKGIDADITFVNHNGFDALANAMIVASVVRVLPNFHHINSREYILVDQSKHAAIGQGLDQLQREGVLTAEQAARGKSVLVHWPNHNDHFHVRILPP